MPDIGDNTLISRSTSVLSAPVRDEIVMMSVESGRYLGLDDIGSDIWRRLETPRTFGELIDGLAADYAADRAVIADDVRKLLSEMAAHNVVKFG
jgi:hypothetical protein